METRSELEMELTMVKAWEDNQKDMWFWEKLGRLPFAILDKLTPKKLQERVLKVVDELGSYLQTGGRYLINKDKQIAKICSRYDLSEKSLDAITRLSIHEMDDEAERIAHARSRLASVQGASTGIGGIWTLLADIPLIMGITLKTLQEIGLAYGFNIDEKEERLFIVKCLQFSSSDIVGKQAILNELANFDEKRKTDAFSQVQGWREVLLTLRENYGWKKLFQLVPIAGIIFGAFINRGALKDAAEAAQMLYKKRRILEKLKEIDGADTNSSAAE